jgi:hypothetical protein
MYVRVVSPPPPFACLVYFNRVLWAFCLGSTGWNMYLDLIEVFCNELPSFLNWNGLHTMTSIDVHSLPNGAFFLFC